MQGGGDVARIHRAVGQRARDAGEPDRSEQGVARHTVGGDVEEAAGEVEGTGHVDGAARTGHRGVGEGVAVEESSQLQGAAIDHDLAAAWDRVCGKGVQGVAALQELKRAAGAGLQCAGIEQGDALDRQRLAGIGGLDGAVVEQLAGGAILAIGQAAVPAHRHPAVDVQRGPQRVRIGDLERAAVELQGGGARAARYRQILDAFNAAEAPGAVGQQRHPRRQSQVQGKVEAAAGVKGAVGGG